MIVLIYTLYTNFLSHENLIFFRILSLLRSSATWTGLSDDLKNIVASLNKTYKYLSNSVIQRCIITMDGSS